MGRRKFKEPVMTNTEQAAEILERTADNFESGRLEWIQNKLRLVNGDGEVFAGCMVGGLNYATWGKLLSVGDQPLDMGTMEAGIVAAEALLNNIGVIHIWNDAPGRTKAEVIDALKTAAKDLRNRGEQ